MIGDVCWGHRLEEGEASADHAPRSLLCVTNESDSHGVGAVSVLEPLLLGASCGTLRVHGDLKGGVTLLSYQSHGGCRE